MPANAPQQPSDDMRSRLLAWRFADTTRMRAPAAATRAAGAWNAPTLAVRILDVPQAEMERYLARPEAAYLRGGIAAQFRDRTRMPGYEHMAPADGAARRPR